MGDTVYLLTFDFAARAQRPTRKAAQRSIAHVVERSQEAGLENSKVTCLPCLPRGSVDTDRDLVGQLDLSTSQITWRDVDQGSGLARLRCGEE